MLVCPATMLSPRQPWVSCSPGCIFLKGKRDGWLTHFPKWHFQHPKSWYLVYKWHLQHTREGGKRGEEESSPRVSSTRGVDLDSMTSARLTEMVCRASLKSTWNELAWSKSRCLSQVIALNSWLPVGRRFWSMQTRAAVRELLHSG